MTQGTAIQWKLSDGERSDTGGAGIKAVAEQGTEANTGNQGAGTPTLKLRSPCHSWTGASGN